MECSAEFKRLQAGGGETAPRVVENGGSAIEASNDEDELPPDWTDRLQMAWQQQRDRYLATHQGISFDTVMALGLPWLTRLRKVPLVEVKDLDKRLGDVNLRFQPIAPGSAAVGISFCNHDPRSYWRRLDRLLKQWNAAREGKLLGQLIILRSAAERTTESGETRVKELRKAGVRVILVERQALAEMAAFQWLLTTSLKGDLTWSGKILDASKYDDWAKENVSGAVKEFFDEVFDLHGLTRSLSALNVSTPAGTPPPAPSGSQPKGGKTATARK